MGQNGAVVADDNHGREDAGRLESGANRGPLVNLNGGVNVGSVKSNLHKTATKHHAYDRGARALARSRGRIARYCGGFEIHCPLDAGVQIPLSAPSPFHLDLGVRLLSAGYSVGLWKLRASMAQHLL